MRQILDHGYVKLIERWGSGESGISEAGIIEAARQSTQGSFRGWEQDQKLLSFLFHNKHSTPFEFAGMTIEVQAPIVVFREWHRHRTQSYNEMSARYAPMPDVQYLPTVERHLLDESGANKQAMAVKGSDDLTDQSATEWNQEILDLQEHSERVYQSGLRRGIKKELARGAVTVFRYSRMRASTDLRNWLGFLSLRMDLKAQWEIRQYANAVGEIIAEQFPQTWALFSEARS